MHWLISGIIAYLIWCFLCSIFLEIKEMRAKKIMASKAKSVGTDGGPREIKTTVENDRKFDK
ncbi:MAG TPA: hypothetical protein VEI28_07525 [Thermodesulfovibrionales bacterium]|nr:hypothetical protein [Thermodesulfovibrionales bacterium]